jgi:hypothetical protein
VRPLCDEQIINDALLEGLLQRSRVDTNLSLGEMRRGPIPEPYPRRYCGMDSRSRFRKQATQFFIQR